MPKFHKSLYEFIALSAAVLILSSPDALAGQASRQAANYMNSERALASNDSLLADYRKERQVILKNISESKNAHLLKQKLKILNNKISYLEWTTKQGRASQSTPAVAKKAQGKAMPAKKASAKSTPSKKVAAKATPPAKKSNPRAIISPVKERIVPIPLKRKTAEPVIIPKPSNSFFSNFFKPLKIDPARPTPPAKPAILEARPKTTMLPSQTRPASPRVLEPVALVARPPNLDSRAQAMPAPSFHGIQPSAAASQPIKTKETVIPKALVPKVVDPVIVPKPSNSFFSKPFQQLKIDSMKTGPLTEPAVSSAHPNIAPFQSESESLSQNILEPATLSRRSAKLGSITQTVSAPSSYRVQPVQISQPIKTKESEIQRPLEHRRMDSVSISKPSNISKPVILSDQPVVRIEKAAVPQGLEPKRIDPVTISKPSNISEPVVLDARPIIIEPLKPAVTPASPAGIKPAALPVQSPKPSLKVDKAHSLASPEVWPVVVQSVRVMKADKTSAIDAPVPMATVPVVSKGVSSPPIKLQEESLKRDQEGRKPGSTKKGGDWARMKERDKEMYVFLALGFLAKQGVVTWKPADFYMRDLDASLEKDRGLEDQYLDDLFIASVYENEPYTRSAIDKLRK